MRPCPSITRLASANIFSSPSACPARPIWLKASALVILSYYKQSNCKGTEESVLRAEPERRVKRCQSLPSTQHLAVYVGFQIPRLLAVFYLRQQGARAGYSCNNQS